MVITEVENFLPNQYKQDNQIEINHNYLQQQFSDHDEILAKIKSLVDKGDFTLGETVNQFEEKFRMAMGAKYAIGVGSGTDAIFLSLKAIGIKEGDEVITTPFTFFATIGAIVTAGATPVFADIGNDYNIDAKNIEAKITKRTKAILPVHWSGKPCDMDAIMEVAQKYQLKVIEDACHAIRATYKGRYAGVLGDVGCFSFHPLKNLNVWGDGGMITTNSDEMANKLRLMRNHGLINRDECEMFSYNSRLDTLQAIVGLHLFSKIEHITDSRIRNAHYLDRHLRTIPQIIVPKRDADIKQVYHLYSVKCKDRDALQAYLIENGVDAKVHYPIPMHLQPAAKYLGYKKGDFPVCEGVSDSTLSLPVHEFIEEEQLEKVVSLIREFYR